MAERIDILLALRADVADLRRMQSETKATQTQFRGLRREVVSFGEAFKIGLGVDLARRGVASFTAMAGAGIQFNAQLETARLGIAAVLKQFDDSGELSTFAAATDRAGEALDMLIEKAKQSPATLRDLIAAYQGTAGAMASAGLTIRQQVDLVALMSQTLAGLGIRSDQILQETRALITGNITEDALAAKILQITKADIDGAKEQGRLFEFLAGKVASFAEAAEAGKLSFNQLSANLRDALDQLAGNASLPAFEVIKDGILAMKNAAEDPALAIELRALAGQIADLLRVGFDLAGMLSRNAALIGSLATALVAGKIVGRLAKMASSLGAMVLSLRAASAAGAGAAASLGAVASAINIPVAAAALGVFAISYWKNWKLAALEAADAVSAGLAAENRDLISQIQSMSSEAERGLAETAVETAIASKRAQIAALEKQAVDAARAARAAARFGAQLGNPAASTGAGGLDQAEQTRLDNLRASLRLDEAKLATIRGQRAEEIIAGNQRREAEFAAEKARRAALRADEASAAALEDRRAKLAELQAGQLSAAGKIAAAQAGLNALDEEAAAVRGRNLAEVGKTAEELATVLAAQESELVRIETERLALEIELRKLLADQATAADKLAKAKAAAAADERKEALAVAEIRLDGIRAERDHLATQADTVARRARLAGLLEAEKGALATLIERYDALAVASGGAGTEAGEAALARAAELRRAAAEVGSGETRRRPSPLESAETRFADFTAAEDRFAAQEDMLRGARAALMDYIASVGTLEEQWAQTQGTILDGLEGAISDSLYDLVTGTGDLADVWRSFGAAAVKTLIDVGVQMLVQSALRSVIRTKETAEEVAASGTRTAAKVPEAVATGIASYGTALIFGALAVALIAAAASSAREQGGRVTPGRPFLVGERRPEIFVPDSAGRILPSVGDSRLPSALSPDFLSPTNRGNGGGRGPAVPAMQRKLTLTQERGIRARKYRDDPTWATEVLEVVRDGSGF